MKKIIKYLLLIIIVVFGTHLKGFSQGYDINATIKGVKDSTVILGHFRLSNSQFVPKDTAKADSEGHIHFSGTQDLPGGLYVILFHNNRSMVQMIYSGDEKKFSLSTDTVDVIEHMKVTGSKENELFYSYQKHLKDKTEESQKLRALKPDGSGADNQAKIQASADEFKNYRAQFLKDNSKSFTASLLKMAADPEIPTAPKLPNGKSDSVWVYNYYRQHYWDNFNFADSRILNTPFFQPKLDRYIKSLIPQQQDSLIKAADALIAKTAVNKEVKEYTVYYITSQYENPTSVGTEGLWVHMANKYYLSGDMGIAEETKKRIADKVGTLKNLLVTKTFPALALTDPSGKKVSPQDIQAKYTVIFFYSPTCGHCKEASPKLKEFFDNNKDKGIKVMTVSTDHNLQEWKDFIIKYNFTELINGFDSTNQIDFNRKFDVVTTPTIYILDKDKKIIARKMPIDQLQDFMNYYQNRVASKL